MTLNKKHTLTIAEVAAYSGYSLSRIREFDDELQPIRLGIRRDRRYDPAMVEAFMAKRKR